MIKIQIQVEEQEWGCCMAPRPAAQPRGAAGGVQEGEGGTHGSE